jgi:hypothetical protein
MLDIPVGMEIKSTCFPLINRTVTTNTFTYNMQSGYRLQLNEPPSGRDRKL